MKKTVFVDFDGTITKCDTCCEMVKAFARDGWQEIDRLWQEKALSTEECANKTFELFDGDLDDLKKLLDTITIDEYFIPFLKLCEESQYKVYILSDGYDFNIRTILEKNDISIPFYSNELLYDNGFRIKCTHGSKSCKDCGCCKKELMEQLSEKGTETVYIGDGYSDRCPSAEADRVYAKGVLYDYCIECGIKVEKYSSFKDIMRSLAAK